MPEAVPLLQHALELVAVGSPLELNRNQSIPTPSPSQVLIKVLVAGLNPHDAMARSLGLFVVPPWSERSALPAVIGNDVVGRIVSVGPAVGRGLSVGDTVVSHADLRHLTASGPTQQHGLQEYAVADSEFIAVVPPDLDNGLDGMATVPTNAIAALFGLFASLPDQTGRGGLGIPAPWMSEVSPEWKQKVHDFDYKRTTVLIVGGGSNCGRWAVQLLRLAGVGRILVVGGNEQELQRLGATSVIDRHGKTEKILEKIRAIVGNDLLYAFDCINPPSSQLLAAQALSTRGKGRLARLVGIPHADVAELAPQSDFDIINVRGGSQLNPEIATPFWERIPIWIADGSLQPTPYERVSVQKDWNDAVLKVNELLDRYDRGDRVVKTHFHFVE